MFGIPPILLMGTCLRAFIGDNLFLRMSDSDVDKIRKELPEAMLFEPIPGKIMSGYVVLPKSVYMNEKVFGEWLKKSVQYASSLPAKLKRSRRCPHRSEFCGSQSIGLELFYSYSDSFFLLSYLRLFQFSIMLKTVFLGSFWIE